MIKLRILCQYCGKYLESDVPEPDTLYTINCPGCGAFIAEWVRENIGE